MIGPSIHLGIGVGHPVSIFGLALLGMLVGFVAGMFGVGGGFILTPSLIHFFNVPAAMAVGSALSEKCGTSLGSLLKYRRGGFGEIRVDLLMLGGSMMGADAGTRLLAQVEQVRSGPFASRTADVVLDGLFLILFAYVLIHTTIEIRRATKRMPRGDRSVPGPFVTRLRIPPYVDFPSVGLSSVSVPVTAYTGFVIGLASGLMGIGGGLLLMPILIYGYGFSIRHAAGTGLLLLLATVATATFEQALRGQVSLLLSMLVLMGSSIGAQFGAMATHLLSNRRLRVAFAVLVFATAAFVSLDLFAKVNP